RDLLILGRALVIALVKVAGQEGEDIVLPMIIIGAAITDTLRQGPGNWPQSHGAVRPEGGGDGISRVCGERQVKTVKARARPRGGKAEAVGVVGVDRGHALTLQRSVRPAKGGVIAEGEAGEGIGFGGGDRWAERAPLP